MSNQDDGYKLAGDTMRVARDEVLRLREALETIALMADEQREHFNWVWEEVLKSRPGRHWDGEGAVIRGGYMTIANKARAILEGKP